MVSLSTLQKEFEWTKKEFMIDPDHNHANHRVQFSSKRFFFFKFIHFVDNNEIEKQISVNNSHKGNTTRQENLLMIADSQHEPYCIQFHMKWLVPTTIRVSSLFIGRIIDSKFKFP